MPQPLFHATANRVETYLGGVEFCLLHPPAGGDIILWGEGCSGRKVEMEEAVGGAHYEFAVLVGIGQGKEIGELVLGDFHSYLFFYFSDDSFLCALSWVDKSANDVECALGWFESSASHEDFALLVLDDCHGGSGGIVVEGEAAIVASLGLTVVDTKAR